MKYNELPSEHHQSRERAVRATGHSRPTKEVNQRKPDGFAAAPPSSGRLFSVYVGQTAVTVLLNNRKRRGIVIQNLSADTVFIGVGTPPAADGLTFQNALAVPSGAVLELKDYVCPIEDITAVSTGASSQISVLECIV